MSEVVEITDYDVHAVIPAKSLPAAIEAISHVEGVVFSVKKHEGKGQTPTCRTTTRGSTNA